MIFPTDTKHFKERTLNHAVIMGRRTFRISSQWSIEKSEGCRSMTTVPESVYTDAFACYSIEDALQLCETQDEVFVIGGAMVYKQTIDMANKLYITEIHHTFENADSFFPAINPSIWKETSGERIIRPINSTPYAYSFVVYERIK